MAKQPFRFTLFLLMCLLVASTAAAQVEIAAVPSADNPAIGDTIEVSINVAGASSVTGYTFTLTFDPTALEFIDIENAEYLPAGAYPLKPELQDGSVSFSSVLVQTGGTGEGDGTLARARFKVLADTETTIGFTTAVLRDSMSGVTLITSPTGATINLDVVNIPDPNLRAAVETALGKVSGATITPSDIATLPQLSAPNANITDLTGLESATNLTVLNLGGNSISDLSPLASLTNLAELDLRDNSISDLSLLVENMGLGEGDWVNVSENPLNSASINTHIPALQDRGVEVLFETEYTLSIPVGYSLIHVPLKVTAVDGVARTITSIGDVYDALGGANAVKLLLTLDSQTQEPFPYILPSDRGTPADRELTDDMGIFADMSTPVSVRLTGSPLGTNRSSIITLNPELNFVGLPLNDSRLTHVSDLFTLEGIGGNAPVVIFTDNGEIKVVTPEGGPDDIPIIGGQAFILDVQRAAMVPISGEGWTNP